MNFKVTILGDVNKPGNYTIPHERITLIEAIGMAGDLNISAIRENILVLRETNGLITETRVNLTTKEIFNSPVLYLQQNDVIYVEQNRAKKNTSVINPTAITLVLSLTTLGVTLLNLLIR
jgi:polysaccharide biosynthesis/export protein